MPHNEIDVDAIASNSWIRTVVHERVVESTNSSVAQLMASGSCDLPLLMLADEQTAGRGRGANRWWSGPGSITLSLAVGREALAIAPQAIYSLAVAIAVRKALSASVEIDRLALKWPNDVILDGRKVAGILLETAGPLASILVVGIGINANNEFLGAPPDVHHGATSLAVATGRSIELTSIIRTLVWGLQSVFSGGATAADLLADYRRADYLAAKHIRVLRAGESITGTGAGIDDAGSLILETDSGSVSIASGTVEVISD